MNLRLTLSRRRLVIFSLAGFALAFALILHLIMISPARQRDPTLLATTGSTPHKQVMATPGLPGRLIIPAIGVDSIVEYVGLTSQGEMGVPKGPDVVAWYNRGPRPGEKGSSVVDGHFDWENGGPAVFSNLYKLHKGDKLYIKDEKGATISFVVRESRSYDPQADARGVFFSSDGEAHLNLITCEGAWNKIQKSYSNRLVVFTDKTL